MTNENKSKHFKRIILHTHQNLKLQNQNSSVIETGLSSLFSLQIQGNLIQGKARLALKNWKNLFGDQREDSLTSLEECYLL